MSLFLQPLYRLRVAVAIRHSFMLFDCIFVILQVFMKTTMKELRGKSEMLTGYLEMLLNNLAAELPEGCAVTSLSVRMTSEMRRGH